MFSLSKKEKEKPAKVAIDLWDTSGLRAMMENMASQMVRQKEQSLQVMWVGYESQVPQQQAKPEPVKPGEDPSFDGAIDWFLEHK